MRRQLLLLFVFSFLAIRMFAQKPVFEKGDKVLSLGVGIGSSVYSDAYYQLIFPNISASLEFGIADHVLEKGVIGVAGYFGYLSYKYEYSRSGWESSNFIIGARGNFHYPLVEKLDTYTGFLLGCEIVSTENFGPDDIDYNKPSSGVQWAWFIGGKYYINESLAAMIELGYGITYVNFGITWKF
jgi:hypothetical protein